MLQNVVVGIFVFVVLFPKFVFICLYNCVVFDCDILFYIMCTSHTYMLLYPMNVTNVAYT